MKLVKLKKKSMKKLTACILMTAMIWTSCSDETVETPNENPVEPPTEEPQPPQEEPTPEENGEESLLPDGCQIGALFSFQRNLRNGIDGNRHNTNVTTFYNRPLFDMVELGLSPGDPSAGTENPETPKAWWDNLVEEIAYSGLDYVAANCRGKRENPEKYGTDAGNPAELTYMIDAMKRRGVADKFKIAIFDDCPASWEAARNEALGRGYAGYNDAKPEKRKPHPLRELKLNLNGDFEDWEMFHDSVYKYIWDLNLKVALQTLNDCSKKDGRDYMFKLDNRPVILFWGNGFIDYKDNDHSDCTGKLLAILRHLREDCKKLIGIYPYLILDQVWEKYDNTLSAAPEVDAMNDWFTIRKIDQESDPYKVRDFRGFKIGTGVPGFSVDDLDATKKAMFVDAKAYSAVPLLEEALKYFVDHKVQLIFLEGFTDVAENAALWRSSDTKFYKYPNQRLNTLRKYSRNPFPKTQKLEAEACDYCYETGGSGNAFSKKMVKQCNDTNYGGGWMVENLGANVAQNLKWKALPFRKGTSVLMVRYTATKEATVYFRTSNSDGSNSTTYPDKKLSPTGTDNWQTVEIGQISNDEYTRLDLFVTVKSGSINLNYIEIIAE